MSRWWWDWGLSWVFVGWVTGAALQLQQAELWPLGFYVLPGGATLLLMAGLRRRQSVFRLSLPVLLAVLAFCWSGGLAWSRMEPISPAWEGRDLDVVGVVEAMPQAQETGWRFRLRIEKAEFEGQPLVLPRRVYLGWYGVSSRDETGTVLPEPVHAGERWSLRVRLKAAHGHLNPRGFDYELWLWERGIRATGYVRQGRLDPEPKRLTQTWHHPVEWARQNVRDRILSRTQGWGQGTDVSGILAALVTGDQAAIERVDWDVFRATGVSHLMSISGVHVTMLGWLVALLVGHLWRRSAMWGWNAPLHWPAPFVAAWSGLLAATAYALFSGWGVPAQRTVWMLAVATLLRLAASDWHWRHVWGLAGVVVVVLDPWALLQPGFWLSFVAVGVLMATGNRTAPMRQSEAATCTNTVFERTTPVPATACLIWLQDVVRKFWGLVREQALISLALLPLSLLFFGQFSVIGLLANLVAIPWVTLVVTPLALAGVLLPWAWDLSAWALQPMSWLLGRLSGLSWASVSLAMPPWPLAMGAMLGALMLVLRGPLSWRVWGIPLLLPALLWQPPRPGHGHFELVAADVGQGNAVLLRTATHSLLYDAGPRYSPESDAGHRVLLPLLAQSGERLDVLMLSHRDTDHTGGAQAVLRMQPQATLGSSLENGHFLREGRDHRSCAAGWAWHWDGVAFEVLHPLQDAVHSRPNALSCVLRVQGTHGSALLVGDIESAQEQEIVARGLGPVDFLLVPHHGSRTSSSEEFLRVAQPRLALVQAGYRNRFGHPAPEVLKRYGLRGTRVLESSRCGAATWNSRFPEHVRCERVAIRRYWHHQPPP